jgi:hypothetical protein
MRIYEILYENAVPTVELDQAGKDFVPPTKTVKAYKLFRVNPKKPGELFPLFVNADKPVKIGVWYEAEEGPAMADPKTGKAGVKSKLGRLAYRPGWHAGDYPIATHIGGEPTKDPVTGKSAPSIRPENQVWAEVEMPADVDWQSEANKRGVNPKGKFVAGKAEIADQIPKGGHYRYKTNPNMTGNWIIGGAMKVTRILSDEEVERINLSAGDQNIRDLPRKTPFDMKKYGFAEGRRK